FLDARARACFFGWACATATAIASETTADVAGAGGPDGALAAAAAFLGRSPPSLAARPDGAAALRALVAGGGATAGAMAGTARSMLRFAGPNATTTRVTDSPSAITSRALRGAGSAINRSGT